jgi:hypothetical protein
MPWYAASCRVGGPKIKAGAASKGNRTLEVEGSIPFGSTQFSEGLALVQLSPAGDGQLEADVAAARHAAPAEHRSGRTVSAPAAPKCRTSVQSSGAREPV